MIVAMTYLISSISKMGANDSIETNANRLKLTIEMHACSLHKIFSHYPDQIQLHIIRIDKMKFHTKN